MAFSNFRRAMAVCAVAVFLGFSVCFCFFNWVWGLIFISLGALFFLANTKNLVNVISVVSIQLGFHVLK